MALVEDTELVDNEPSSEEIAIWAAVLVLAADALALYALLKARKEKASQPDTTQNKTQDFEIRRTNRPRSGSRR
ncbi:hypothetical protein H8B09_00195 [Paenibacillus sp. PR3]|uniref:Uncharacterized protein n=1 Tax=Paenibacillus terricola TaxID=2763503 RepID=A0ABR8MMB9_9BACL|nr:hypothetical protein [Paenibacillus terricola]MBD3917156.1 hypothetical protein [Paenibacillus terricola]